MVISHPSAACSGEPEGPFTVLPESLFAQCAQADLLHQGRIWAVARGLRSSGTGSGVVGVDELRQHLSEYVDPRTARAWVETLLTKPDGTASPFVEVYYSTKHRRWEMRLRAPGVVLATLGKVPSRRHVRFRVDGLLSRSWRREVHLAVASARDGLPTSRVVHRARSSVSVTTQRRAERDAGLVPERNARAFEPGDPKTPVLRPGVFARRDGTVLERLPNTLTVGRKVTRRRTLSVGVDSAPAVTRAAMRRYHDRPSGKVRGEWISASRVTRDVYGGADKLARGGRLGGFRVWTAERGSVST